MKFSPLPHGFRATCSLIKRDHKNLVNRKTVPDNLQHRFQHLDAYGKGSHPACGFVASAPAVLRKSQRDRLQIPIRNCRPARSLMSTTAMTFSRGVEGGSSGPTSPSEFVPSAPISPSTATEYGVNVTSRTFPYADIYPKLGSGMEPSSAQTEP
jgi:hypothetical protein